MIDRERIWIRRGRVTGDTFEIVERKGVGHPDTLADGIAELASCMYSEYCVDEFDAVLHHNLDKVAVLGGLARFSWEDGEFVRPLRVIFGGRASTSFGRFSIPLKDILESAANRYLRYALPGAVKPPVEFFHQTTSSSKFERWFNPESTADLPERTFPRANDTAYLVGAGPLTHAEQIALQCEARLRQCEWAGSDIKVLVVRADDRLNVTICVPALVGKFRSAREYRDAIELARQEVSAYVASGHGGFALDLVLNSHCARPPDGAPATAGYANLSGSSVDYGEDGLVGRGNSRSGLIQPMRHHGNEVLFGKNPTYHVGKACGYFADEIATRISATGAACECAITTRIGAPLEEPETCVITIDGPIEDGFVQQTVKEVFLDQDRVANIVRRRRYVPRLWGEGTEAWNSLLSKPATSVPQS